MEELFKIPTVTINRRFSPPHFNGASIQGHYTVEVNSRWSQVDFATCSAFGCALITYHRVNENRSLGYTHAFSEVDVKKEWHTMLLSHLTSEDSAFGAELIETDSDTFNVKITKHGKIHTFLSFKFTVGAFSDDGLVTQEYTNLRYRRSHYA